MYIGNLLVFNIRNHLRLNLNRVEDLWIKITVNIKPYVVGVVYRHPACLMAEFDLFSKLVWDTLLNLNLKKINFCILGDLNIDLLCNREHNNTRKYADNLAAQRSVLLINRLASLLTKNVPYYIYINSCNKI